MKNFKIEAAKWLQKYSFIRKAGSEQEIKDLLHREWFSLLSLQEVGDVQLQGGKIYFEIVQNGDVKKGTIVASDIFKAFLKLKFQLKYDLKYIYTKENASLEEKQKTIYQLTEQYRVYVAAHKKQLEAKEQEEKSKIKVVEEVKIEDFQMKKELDDVYKTIAKVLEKLQHFIQSWTFVISSERKQKLVEIYQAIIKLKSSTNITKLRQISELALKKIGEIEIEHLQKSKDEQTRELLKQTNALLKEVGSKDAFILQEEDVVYQIKSFFQQVGDFVKGSFQKEEKKEIDITSDSYSKTLVLIDKYSKKLKIYEKERFQRFYIYLIPTEKNKQQSDILDMKIKILQQNLLIFRSRIDWKVPSYTKIKKGYYTFLEYFIAWVVYGRKLLIYLVFTYSAVFVILLNIQFFGLHQMVFYFSGLFYFLFINIAFFVLQIVKWLMSFIFSIAFLSFLFMVGMINF